MLKTSTFQHQCKIFACFDSLKSGCQQNKLKLKDNKTEENVQRKALTSILRSLVSESF